MLINVCSKLINTAQVLWIEPAPSTRGMPRSTIHFTNGTTLTVSADLDWIANRQTAVFPAPPGYQAVRATPPSQSDEDRSVDYDTLPVVAFRFDGASNLLLDPITPEGTLGDYYAVIGPDGRCWDVDREYESVEAYKQSFSQDWANDKAVWAGEAA
ncbi:hypothetical protein [Methylobacterium sp. E-046]|uniref:hypothetical protein n=1 Tax=Methylobacterium sp. E-046 TaxID=2836576 RepID=UPI001FBA32DF|nr:hypothetical protein [Methylobacterium sp. E-046]MCJ2097231.1 hypothetical protein [Methylobacterium sp. E-046]